MRTYLLLLSELLLISCSGNPQPPESVPLTPHFVLGTSGRQVTIQLLQPAFVTVFAFSEIGHNTLIAPLTPVGRLSFGPQPAGRSEVRLTQASRYTVGPTAAFLAGNPASPEPETRTAVWSLDDWPILVVVASEAPLDPGVIRKAIPVRDPRAQYVRSAAERRAGRLATAGRFLTLLQQGQPLLARTLIEHHVH